MKKKILNLYAGIGGNRKLWPDHYHITAVEHNAKIAAQYKAFFPEDTVLVEDAKEYLYQNYMNFDFIWASPPCQTHTKLIYTHKNPKPPDSSLWEIITFLREKSKEHNFLYVVENVKPYYTPPIYPDFCIDRHFFWSNFFVLSPKLQKPRGLLDSADHKRKKETLHNFIGLHYEGNIYTGTSHSTTQVLRNCVHPEIGLQILTEAEKYF